MISSNIFKFLLDIILVNIIGEYICMFNLRQREHFVWKFARVDIKDTNEEHCAWNAFPSTSDNSLFLLQHLQEVNINYFLFY